MQRRQLRVDKGHTDTLAEHRGQLLQVEAIYPFQREGMRRLVPAPWYTKEVVVDELEEFPDDRVPCENYLPNSVSSQEQMHLVGIGEDVVVAVLS